MAAELRDGAKEGESVVYNTDTGIFEPGGTDRRRSRTPQHKNATPQRWHGLRRRV